MTATIDARLFLPGRDASGIAVRAGFSAGRLGLAGVDGLDAVPATRITLKTGGFDGRQWFIEWPVEGGMASLMLPDAAAARALLAGAPPELARQIAAHTAREHRRERRFRLGVAVIAVFLALPILALALFWLNADRLAGWAAGHVSLAQEQALGDLAFAQMRPGLRLRPSGPAPDVVRALGERLTTGSRYRYRWFVAESQEVNAFAMPGGYVVVYTGLLKAADSPEEVAGVLAHEVQHVELRHSLKNMIHALGWRAVLALALGDLSGGVWGDMAGRLGSLSYSRDLERAADLGGLAALRQAGIAPEGMVSFFAKLARQEGPGIALLASHPATSERIEQLRQTVAAGWAYPVTALPYDWTRLRAGL